MIAGFIAYFLICLLIIVALLHSMSVEERKCKAFEKSVHDIVSEIEDVAEKKGLDSTQMIVNSLQRLLDEIRSI